MKNHHRVTHILLIVIITMLFLMLMNSCIGHNYVSKEQKQRVKQSLKESYPERKNRPHKSIIEDFVYDEDNRQIYHSAWTKPLTWNDIQATGIDSLRTKYLFWYAERD